MSEQIEEQIEELEQGLEEVQKQGLVKQAIIIELQEKAKLALKFKRSRDEAKTTNKHDFYDRKLKKNNQDVPDLIQALQRLTDIEEARREQALNEKGIIEGESLEVQENPGPNSPGGVIELTSD